jgi:hypothetical protein
MMELDMATVEEKKYREFKEHKRVKRHTTSFEFQEDKEFAKVFNTTSEFQEDEEFDRLVNDTSFNFKEDSEIDEMFGDITRESFTNEHEEHENKLQTEKFEEEEEFASVFYTTTFEFKEDEEFDRMFNNTTFDFKENERFEEMIIIAKGSFTNKFEEQANEFLTDEYEENVENQEAQCPVLRGGCNQEEFETFAQKWGLYAGCNCERDARELRQQLLNCAVGPLEHIMYNALGSKLDTLSEVALMEELERLAVVKSIAEVQDVNYPAMVYMENTAKKPNTHITPAHCSPTHKSPAHSGHQVHSPHIPRESRRRSLGYNCPASQAYTARPGSRRHGSTRRGPTCPSCTARRRPGSTCRNRSWDHH